MHTQTDTPGAQDVPVAVPYASLPTRPVRTCFEDTLNVGLLLTFPCEPIARASSSVGISYAGAFLAVALVYGGGIVCFGASTADDHAVFDRISVGYAVLVAWILSLVGAIPSIPFVLFWWALTYAGPSIDEDPDTNFEASDTSKALVIAFMVSQIIFSAVVGYLRHEILTRSGASTCCSSCIGSCCFTLCFPPCSFAEAWQRARAVQDHEPVNGPGRDELPACVE